MSAAARGASWYRFPPLRNALAAGALALAAFGIERFEAASPSVAYAVYGIAIVLGAWHWASEAIAELLHERAIGIEFLMLAATGGALALGMWDEAAALVILFAAAEGVESYTQVRTRNAIRRLMDLMPATVRVVTAEGDREQPATKLAAGARFRVRPGERVATDGRIVDGRSSLNQAPVTGESLPVDKAPGDDVFAGSINGEGALLIEATRPFADNSIARIIHLVESAQEQKGRAQQWIDRFGRRYTPAVFAVAVLMIVAPWLLGQPLDAWAHRAVVLLVAAAPCALVMSMPMAMATGIGRASRRGILVKGGVHLEHLAKVRWVALDKTGTLTHGTPVLAALNLLDGASRDDALAVAAGLEQLSQHPLAIAVRGAAAAAGLAPAAVDDAAAIVGSGVRGRLRGEEWYLASQTWWAARGPLAATVEQRIVALQESGHTVAILGRGDRPIAVLGLADEPRPEAIEALRRLHALGIGSTMLTGDHARTAATVAARLGIDDVRADLKPEAKVAAVREIEAARGPTLMVGDGINDAPALAAATCGVAMGAAGSDAALEAADVALMTNDLRRIPLAIELARDVGRISRQNIVLSIAVLAAMIPLAVLGLIGVTTAVIVHEAAELIAVFNGLRAGARAGIAPAPAPTAAVPATDDGVR
jgi:Cd2+/Zn2+-exporting ATPase